MRKCLDCNAKLADVAMVCSECGSENLSFIENESDSVLKEKKSFFVLYVIIAAVIIAIIAGVIGYKYYSKSVPAEPVVKGMYSLITGDCQGYVDEMNQTFKTDTENYLENQFGTFESYQTEQEQNLKKTFGKNYKINADVVDVYDVSDVMVAALAKNCTDAGYNIDIQAAKYVTVRVVIKGDDGLEDYSYQSRYSIQVDGDWYLYQELTSSSDNATTEK